uniref:Uncharacterized protein n=2 Tax=Nicotiana TaxID=4085 RepID=A0A1S4BLU6_TOBAC|nr:PREDICTED: uncharacterized protein LOC104224235 [Nicotiana sylvestris]XP_016489812.1 PREDICTED: uncharacterized protein LOC107809670 [Nicotiana tabacum]
MLDVSIFSLCGVCMEFRCFAEKLFCYFTGFLSLNVELLVQPLKLHPAQMKTALDKFAAVGILQTTPPLYTSHCSLCSQIYFAPSSVCRNGSRSTPFIVLSVQSSTNQNDWLLQFEIVNCFV